MSHDDKDLESWQTKSKQKLRKLPGVKQILNHLGERNRNAKFDQQTQRLERKHKRALETAASEHDLVRARAERAVVEHELHLLRRQKKEQKRLEEQRKKTEAARAELVQQERSIYEQQLEDERRAEQEQARLDADRRAAEEHRLKRAQQKKASEEAAEAERRKREAEQEEQRRAQSEAAPPQPTPATVPAPTPAPPLTPVSSAPSSSEPHIRLHYQYLELHARLKQLRKNMTAAKQQYPNLKKDLGDFRRDVRKRMGQFTEDKDENRKILTLLAEAVLKGNSVAGPLVDVRDYVVRSLLPTVDLSDNQVPALRIFLLNIMAKSAVQQLVVAAGPKPETADPIGLACVSVFANHNLRWQGFPLSDILLAKLHQSVPVLFGINGDEATNQGRTNLGWARDPHPTAKHEWLLEHSATEKWIGIGAGFAACTLRLYRSPTLHPLPPTLFWESAARLLNTPPNERTQAHFFLLRAFIEYSTPKIITTFGQQGLALIQRALKTYPTESGSARGASSLASIVATVKRDYNLIL